MERKILLCACLIAGLCFAGGNSLGAQTFEEGMLEARRGAPSPDVVMNPVTDFDCADPSLVQIGEWFYLFKTGYPIKIYRSRDLCNWEFYRDMFPGPSPLDPYGDGVLDPMGTGVLGTGGRGRKGAGGAGGREVPRINYWAPSPAVIQGRIVVYLTLFVSMENDRQVVCVADDIDGEFRYVNTLNVGTPEHPTPQDGQYFLDDDGRHYLVYGDVNSKGDFIRELAPDGIHYAEGSVPHYITTAYEGCYIYKHGGKYYCFCSCNFYNSYEYTLCMSVSDSLTSGWSEPVPVLTSESPTAILNGAGHNGEIVTDRDGRMFMIMHAHCVGLIPRRGDYHPRPMILMELQEKDGVLTFVNHKGEPVEHPQWLVRKPRF